MPEVPDMLILKERPLRVGPQTALAKLTVEWLQLRFTALLRTDTQRLNMAYTSAGLINSLISLRYQPETGPGP